MRDFVLGGVLGLGAPLGFLGLRYALGLGRRRPGRLLRLLREEWSALGYMSVTTPFAFGLFGRALGRREEKLEEASSHVERLREEFAAVVAHDLRSPIQTILMQLDGLRLAEREGQVVVPVAAVQRLHRAGERLAEMVNDLLDATRIEAARLSVRPERLPLAEALAALLDRLGATLGAHPVGLDVPIELAARADPTRFDQILTNLLENAAKYSAEGAPIRVAARADGGEVVVAVEDRGGGIAPEDLPRLFDRFYQAKRAREKKSGLGLGLYITKGLVEAHGGRIHVETRLGRGSTFSVWLPRA